MKLYNAIKNIITASALSAIYNGMLVPTTPTNEKAWLTIGVFLTVFTGLHATDCQYFKELKKRRERSRNAR